MYLTLCHLYLTKRTEEALCVNFGASTTSVPGAVRYRRVETIKKKTRPIPRATALPLRAYGNFIYELLYNIPGTLDSVGVYCFTPQQLLRRAPASFLPLHPTISPSQSASFSPSKRVKGIPAGVGFHSRSTQPGERHT